MNPEQSNQGSSVRANTKADSTNYDVYYRKGMYRENYKHRTISRLREIVLCTAREIAQRRENKEITIFDHGCGDGRYFQVAELLAQEGIKVHFIGYDITREGLRCFAEDLHKKDYVDVFNHLVGDENQSPVAQSEKENKGGKNQQGYVAAKLVVSKDANAEALPVSVTLIKGSEHDTRFSKISLVPQKIDLALSMYSPLGHIPRQENRNEEMRFINSLLKPDGRLIATVALNLPEYGENIATASRLRQANAPQGEAKEPGDFYYQWTRDHEDGTHTEVNNFLHVFTIAEIRKHIRESGFRMSQFGIQAANTIHQKVLTSDPEQDEQDCERTKAMITEDEVAQARFAVFRVMPSGSVG